MVLQMMDVSPFKMTLYDKTEYVYPTGAKAVGWILALSSILMIPIVAIITLCQKQGTIREVNARNASILYSIRKKTSC